MLKDQVNNSKIKGIPSDQLVVDLKKKILSSKIRSHEYHESKKIVDIKKNNQFLLDKLLDISKGKQSTTNQKNLKIPRGASKSLNYVFKKKEAQRIDRENQKILNRIINIKPHKQVDTRQLHKDFQ